MKVSANPHALQCPTRGGCYGQFAILQGVGFVCTGHLTECLAANGYTSRVDDWDLRQLVRNWSVSATAQREGFGL